MPMSTRSAKASTWWMKLSLFAPGRTRPRGDRGASGVEYALIISPVLVGSMSSFELMDQRVEANYSETAGNIGNPDLDAFNATTTACASCPTTTTTSAAAPTTTTAPPTTAAPTTTTTRSPTTSTTTTTTTTKPGTTASAQGSNSSGYDKKDKSYSVAGTFTLETPDGKDIQKADVTYTIRLKTGQTKTFIATTGNKGRVSIDWSGFPSNAIYPATITITSVTLNGETFAPSPSVFVWSGD